MKRLLTSAALFLCSLLTFAQFSGSGSGTESDPYLILNPIQLNQLRNYLNKTGVYFKLMADIDLTEFLEDENPSQGWQPVGNSSSAAFKGVLDGNGKTIAGLWIKRSSMDYVGFFGYMVGATIKNLSIDALTIEGQNNVGLFGYTDGSTIENLNIGVSMIEGKESVGGISGQSQGSSIIGCTFRGSVIGESKIGGYIGYALRNMILSDNTAIVNITGTGNSVGGFVGLSVNKLSVSGCTLNDGIIRGVNNVGGCCGENRTGSYDISISNTYIHANITGVDYVGGICALSTNNYIDNCGYCGEITGYSNVGGLVGKTQENATIKNSFAIGTISATGAYVGGLIGYDEGFFHSTSSHIWKNYTTLSNDYHSGPVTGGNYVGGLVGYNKYGEISNCYSIGSVAGARYVGGLLGYQESSTTLKKSVAINTRVTATMGDVNRVVGYNAGTIGTMGSTDENKSYNKTIVINQGVAQEIMDNDLNGTGVSATTLKLKATYVAMSWDFNDIWEIQETECYPYFKTQTAPPVITSQVVSGATTVSGKCVDGGTITLEIDGEKQQVVSSGNSFSFTVSPLQAGHEVRVSAKADGKEQSYYTTEVVSFLGKGTETDPYQISTAADLTEVYRKGYYKLMNDIDLTSYINQNCGSEGWESIGREGSETVYFDGDGHKIMGLWCNSTRDNTGLFSCFANGYIKNLTVEVANGKKVSGGYNTGIIIGKLINGEITNCKVSGKLGDGTPVGGIVGMLEGGKVSLCQANTDISTTGTNTYAGGIAGESTGIIEQCVTQGSISATGSGSYAAGIAGKSSVQINNSYSDMKLSSAYCAAGIVGYNYGLVDKCYAYGNLSSSNYAAGIIGYNDGANAIVKNCVAMNIKIDVKYESQSSQSGGYGQRIIGGIKNGAPAPEMNNYALKTMQVSVNDVPQKVYDDIMNGVAKTQAELTTSSPYQTLGWDFSSVWSIEAGMGYPYLKNIGNVSENPAILYNLFYKVDGEVYKTFQLASGDAITPLAEPTKEGYKFSGWSEIPGTMPEHDFTVTGTFTKVETVDTENVLTMDNLDGYVGGTVVLPILMNNKAQITGLRFDLYLPAGISVALNARGKNDITVTGRMEESYSISSNTMADGSIRVTGLSLDSTPFTGNSGAIINVVLKVDASVADGNYQLQLKNITLSDVTGTYYKPANSSCVFAVKSYMMGDVDGSGEVNINDAVCIVNHILNKTPANFIAAAADLDGSGEININDAVVLINKYILKKANAKAMKAPRRAATGADNYLSIDALTIKPGETKTVTVNLTNTESIQGLQCNVKLPQGLSFATKASGKIDISNDADRGDGFTLSSSLQEDGSLTVATLNFEGDAYVGKTGTVFTFKVKASEDMSAGVYEILIHDIVLSSGVAIKPSDATGKVTVEGSSSGLQQIDADSNQSDSIYNLNGQRVNNPSHGIYIVNGRKVLVK